jgi:hypothetical protein
VGGINITLSQMITVLLLNVWIFNKQLGRLTFDNNAVVLSYKMFDRIITLQISGSF